MNDGETKNGTPKPLRLTRRDAIAKVCALLGGTSIAGQAAMLAGCEDREPAPPVGEADAGVGQFTAEQVALLDEIAETILPETTTPGAKSAGVGPFIALMVTDTYSPAEQQVFMDGLAAIDEESRSDYGRSFMELAPEQRTELAVRLDRMQFDAMQAGAEPPHYFRMIKELTVLGLFTSEAGYSEILEYAETPGRYDPCRDLGPGVRMMAGHASQIWNT